MEPMENQGAGIDLSIVVPIYNEEADLVPMAEGLASHLDEIVGGGRWQFVLVDNGSKDGSGNICKEIIRRWPASVMIHLERPDYGDALYAGIAGAAAPWVYIINVDFWDIPFLRWCYRTRGIYDLVMGSKRADTSLNHQHFYRRVLSWGLNTLLQTVFSFAGSDTHGQKFLHVPTLLPILKKCVMRRGQFDTEFTIRAMRQQLWLAEAPVPIVELRAPRNLMLKKVVQNILDIFRLYHHLSAVPLGALRYHRWAREDIETMDDHQIHLLMELGRHHQQKVAGQKPASDGN